ncbi:MAG: cysteine desulfurase family protein [Bradymonadaceae bacterium]
MIYLDHNATTPVRDEVREAMMPFLREQFGNPSSGHPYGRRAHEAVERARDQVADLIGARSTEIIFTSGGTESNNLAIRGVCSALGGEGAVVTSEIEHPAVAETCEHLEATGRPIESVGVGGDGRVDLEAFDEALAGEVALVSIMHANNETGVLQPIGPCADRAGEAGALLHTDAAQSVGKVPVDVDELGVDLLTIAGHKLYGPKGVGALYIREGTPIEPILYGASHEGGLRPGTENVASIVGLGAACELASRTVDEERARVESLRDRLVERLRDAIPDIAVTGADVPRLPNTLNVRFPETRGDELLAATPEVAASTGSACHEGGELQPSSVLTAMGIPDEDALGAVRLTLGRGTTADEVDRVAEALIEARNPAHPSGCTHR